MSAKSRGPKRATTRFDAKHHRLNYKFDYNRSETAALWKSMRANDSIKLSDLHRIALWKLGRVLQVPEALLQRLRQIATAKSLRIDSQESKEVLEALVRCKGVGFPMASSFLKFLRPDVFPIIDVRAYRALFGQRLSSKSYSLDLYLGYAKEIRTIAARTGLKLHEVDEQLYLFDRKHNKGIAI